MGGNDLAYALWTLPVLQLIAAGAAAAAGTAPRAWRLLQAISLGALAVAGGVAGFALLRWVGGAAAGPDGAGTDGIGVLMSLLVALLGWVITRFSATYLQGEAGQPRYAAALAATLAAVHTVALTDHLVVLVLAWSATSLSLHILLTFYRERAAATIVAHKKFLASRLAEVCLVAALALIYSETGTFSLSQIAAQVAQLEAFPLALHAAMVLVALAAILKSAQLPVHGWLIQVMEAPTPVSALLHAGVVNLGGFVLIRLAALLSAAPAAQTVLVVVGGLTAVLAGLVMLTRISIKVRLAWSTCAQMGFMLMECGLGLYELALLHLIAHSLYKAHGFLSAGDTVLAARRDALQGAAANLAVPFGVRLVAAPLALVLVAATAWGWQQFTGLDVPAIAVLIVALGLAPLLQPAAGATLRGWLTGGAALFGLVNLYMLWHLAFGAVLAPAAHPPVALAAGVSVAFVALYLVQAWLMAFPRGRLSSTLHPWAFAGFYLDERFTRLTFRVWPARTEQAVTHSIG